MTKAHKKAILGYRKGIKKLIAKSVVLEVEKNKKFIIVDEPKIEFLYRMIRNCQR